MDKELSTELFKAFLIENHAYEQFCQNINLYVSTFEEYIKKMIEYKHGPERYLRGAFEWHKTVQGFHYWSDLDDLWIDTLIVKGIIDEVNW